MPPKLRTPLVMNDLAPPAGATNGNWVRVEKHTKDIRLGLFRCVNDKCKRFLHVWLSGHVQRKFTQQCLGCKRHRHVEAVWEGERTAIAATKTHITALCSACAAGECTFGRRRK